MISKRHCSDWFHAMIRKLERLCLQFVDSGVLTVRKIRCMGALLIAPLVVPVPLLC